MKSKSKSTVKNILFRIEVKGEGIVNYDSSNQGSFINGVIYGGSPITNSEGEVVKSRIAFPLINGLDLKNKNITFAKKNFYLNKEENRLDYKIKISNDCIRNAMFAGELISMTPAIMANPYTLNNYLASEVAILRGYLELDKTISYKRKSALFLTDFEQTCNAISKFDVHSKSGSKVNLDVDSDLSEANFWNTEHVGKISYSGIGGLDIAQLQFISASNMYDRLAINSDKFSIYKEILSKRIPSTQNAVLDYFLMKDSVIESSEYGLLLDNDAINHMVKYTLNRLLNLNVKRSKAYAQVTTLKMLIVENPLTDTMESDDSKWITVTNEVIEKLNLDYHVFYEKHVPLVSIEEELALIEEKRKKKEAETKRKAREREAKKLKEAEEKEAQKLKEAQLQG